MSNYKCTDSFMSSKGKSYSYGEKISYSEHSSLTMLEQTNFKKESGSYRFSTPSSYDGSSSSPSPSIGDMFGTGMLGGIDMDITTPW